MTKAHFINAAKKFFGIMWSNSEIEYCFCLKFKRRDAGGGGAGEGACAPPPSFGISVNPIWTKGGRLCPPYYYWPPIFLDDAVSALYVIIKGRPR